MCPRLFTGADQPYDKLRRALKAEIDEGAWSSLYSTVSRPFPKPTTGKISGQLNASQAIFHKEAEFPGLTVTELAEFSDTIFFRTGRFLRSQDRGQIAGRSPEVGAPYWREESSKGR